MIHLIFVFFWPKEATVNSSPRPRRLPRLAASAVALATATGLALSTFPAVSAQQPPPPATQAAEDAQTTPPPERTDTTLPAAPMPSDAMPLDEPPARASAMARQSPGTALSQAQWNRRPVAQRGQTPQLEQEWRATDSPNREVVPGEMRSDREEVPAGFTKAEADRAETMEAALTGNDGKIQTLAAPGCQVYWPAPYEVCGAIRDKYNELGGPNSFLLFPKTNELTNPDGIGKRTEFLNGPIYWSPQGGAHPVVNHFLAAWARHQYENGYLGYPTTDEIVNPDGIGRRQHFEGSTIYWQLNKAYSVGGAIADRWHELGAERSDGLLGYPLSDEEILPDGVGRMNRFQRGVIYWHPDTGAHEVVGFIQLLWEFTGHETGPFGYPASSPAQSADASITQQFANGTFNQSSPAEFLEFIAVDGTYGNESSISRELEGGGAGGNFGFGGAGGKFCTNDVFGWTTFESMRDSLNSWYSINKNRVWQAPDDNSVWKTWCHITNGEASIRQVGNEDEVIKPSPRYDLNDGTVNYFRTESKSGGYTIDINPQHLEGTWKIHVAR